MPASWLYVIGGIIIGILIFTIGYHLISISINQAQKQTALSNFNDLHTNIQMTCFQEINNSMLIKLQVPNSVRVLYTTDDNKNLLDTVVDKIQNKEYSSGHYLCMQFKEEQELRCQKIDCLTDIPYMGSLPKELDIQLMVKKILGKAPVKEYTLEIKKISGDHVYVSIGKELSPIPTTTLPTTTPSTTLPPIEES